MKKSKRIFITGGTGFIGTKLVNELAQRGYAVHLLKRASSNVEGLARQGVSFFTGDLMDRDSLRRGMEGCREVYHLAAYAKNWAKDSTIFYQLNVEGLCKVWQAATEAGVERIVFTSTFVTCGPTPRGRVGDERSHCSLPECQTDYQASKRMAEEQVCNLSGSGVPVVVVNPTRVYGPGKMSEGNSVSRMIDLYDRGRFPLLLNHGVNVGNYVFVDDVVQGLLLAMEKGNPGELYILGGENVALRQFFQLIDEISGETHFRINAPPWLALLYARWQQKKAEWFGSYPSITPGWVETFLQDWAYSSAKAEKELGYKITPLREGMRITLEWLRSVRKSSS